MSAPRALVTGGAGFIGSHVCDTLAAAGYSVTALDDLSTGKRENLASGIALEQLDIRSPEAAALVRGGNFNVVCHLAAQIDVRKSVTDPANDASLNVVGSLNIIQAANQAPTRPRVVFSSTGGAIYGDFVTVPNEETQPKDPESPYGIAKLSVEYYLSYFGRVQGLEVVQLRYANVYGPRQDPHGEAGVVAIFCQRILAGRELTVFGDGTQVRDYVYVGDVARANLLAARMNLPRAAQVDVRAYNIGTGKATSVLELAASLQRAASKQLPINHAAARPGEQMRSVLRIDKAMGGLGWTPQVPLDAGLKQTYEWFRTQAK